MLNNKSICRKVQEIFPEKGQCGKDMKVEYSKKHNTYLLNYKENGEKKKTFLDIDETSMCIEKERCIDFGFQVNQIR